jgi:hypothetical protein
MKDFNYWKSIHDSESLEEFSADKTGLLWLKLKSIIRKEYISGFVKENNIQLAEKSLNKQFAELFEILANYIDKSHDLLDSFIRKENNLILSKIDTEKLVSELYKLKTFDWGGDYQNSLDKYLVSRFVKVYNSYEILCAKLETDIGVAVKGYVLNSWYNHWSSILIEHIFKSHPKVLPTVGQIKNVDFFISDIPFDLKVTYLPNEYIKQKRKEHGFPVELTYLKENARIADISFDNNTKENNIYYEIFEKMADKDDDFCRNTLQTIKNQKLTILHEAQNNPKMLAKWLYENQGSMRFSSENRIYLVLVDTNDFSNSWKLKRNISLLSPSIKSYLDDFHHKNNDELQISFTYSGKPQQFTALTDILFVVK